MKYGYESGAENLDKMVLGAIKMFSAEKPAMRGDLWRMNIVRLACCSYGISLQFSLQRLKKAGKIKYSRMPAGWVACE